MVAAFVVCVVEDDVVCKKNAEWFCFFRLKQFTEHYESLLQHDKKSCMI